MKDKTYTFTGFMPSGNPFLWYYDKNIHTAFADSIEVSTWDKQPKKGDKIRIIKTDTGKNTQVFINGKQVYEFSEEKEKEVQKRTDDIYDDIKQKKGFL